MAGFKYKVLEQVKVPLLKIAEDTEVGIRVLQPIQERQTEVKGDDGVLRMKTIEILRVLDHSDKVVKDTVAGVGLGRSLKEYGGGNNAYVGLDFLIVKRKPQPGKRFKDWEVSRIEVPDEA